MSRSDQSPDPVLLPGGRSLPGRYRRRHDWQRDERPCKRRV